MVVVVSIVVVIIVIIFVIIVIIVMLGKLIFKFDLNTVWANRLWNKQLLSIMLKSA